MKALTLVLCILALLGSAASGFFWWEVGNKRAVAEAKADSEEVRANNLQTELTSTTGSLEITRNRLASTDAELGDTKSRLTAAEARNIQVSREVASLKSTLTEKERTEQKLNTDLDNLRRELVQTRLAAQVGSPDEVERYKQTIASLEARLGGLQSGGPVTDSTGAVSPAAPSSFARSERTAAARVATVGTRNSFVVLDLGTQDGITAGDKFLITRVGETIAESVISEVKDTFAIAQITPASIKTTLKAGDIATYAK